MATMTIRTTVAFDPATVARWERLTKRWGVSKSEALRRALEVAEMPALPAQHPSQPEKTPPPSAAGDRPNVTCGGIGLAGVS